MYELQRIMGIQSTFNQLCWGICAKNKHTIILFDQMKQEQPFLPSFGKNLLNKQVGIMQNKDEELDQDINYNFIYNDQTRESSFLLIGLKNVFAKHLPKMPKKHIARLLFDQSHACIVVKQGDRNIIGGACFRTFETKNFTQLAFLSVQNKYQKKGIGAKIINHLQKHLQQKQIQYIVTFADLSAINFFKKKGFMKIEESDKNRWEGFVKNYQGGMLMECRISQKVNYMNIKQIVKEQKQQLLRQINKIPWVKQEFSMYDAVRKAKKYERINSDGRVEEYCINPYQIPGILESGWVWEDYQKMVKSLTIQETLDCYGIIDKLKKHPAMKSSKEPISTNMSPDYEMQADLKKIEVKLVSNQYKTTEQFSEGILSIFRNCKKFHSPQTRLYNYSIQLQDYIQPQLDKILGKFEEEENLIQRKLRTVKK